MAWLHLPAVQYVSGAAGVLFSLQLNEITTVWQQSPVLWPNHHGDSLAHRLWQKDVLLVVMFSSFSCSPLCGLTAAQSIVSSDISASQTHSTPANQPRECFIFYTQLSVLSGKVSVIFS